MYNMKWLILFFSLYPLIALPQGKGLILTDPGYKENIRRQYIGPAFADEELPPKISLRKYCPIPGDQGNMGSCVGWAVGYGAYSILHAAQTNNTNRQQITATSFSALYLYNQVKVSDCEKGAVLSKALLFSKQRGDCRKSVFHPENCYVMPDAGLPTVKTKDYQALFYGNESKRIKLNAVKQKIADNIPVIIGFETNKFFSGQYITRDNPVWRAGGSSSSGHAVVIVGYDDATELFEVLNSWGTSFGDQGFFYMKYEDFIIYTQYAAAMVLSDVSQKIEIKGECTLRYFDRELQKMQDVVMQYQNSQYETATGKWAAGSIFQLAVKNKQEKQYIYVYSLNNKGDVKIHFPRRKEFNNINVFDEAQNESEFFSQKRSVLFIPNEKTGLQLNATDEYLIVLFSKSEIPGFHTVVAAINSKRASGLTLLQSINQTLNNRVVVPGEVSFVNNVMMFNASSNERDVVPVIIHLRSQ